MKYNFRFKTIDELRTHSKLRCEICSDIFCKQSDLAEHQQQGCEALIESPDLVDSKPTFIDCNLEPEMNLDEHEEASFASTIVVKEMDGTDDDSLNGVDHSNHAEISAENETMQLESGRARVVKKRGRKKSQKKSIPKRNEQQDKYDAADRKFHCYLCEKK